MSPRSGYASVFENLARHIPSHIAQPMVNLIAQRRRTYLRVGFSNRTGACFRSMAETANHLVIPERTVRAPGQRVVVSVDQHRPPSCVQCREYDVLIVVVLHRLLDGVGERAWLMISTTDKSGGGHLFPDTEASIALWAQGSTCTRGSEHAGRSRCQCARCSSTDLFHIVVARPRRTPIAPAVMATAVFRRRRALDSIDLPPLRRLRRR